MAPEIPAKDATVHTPSPHTLLTLQSRSYLPPFETGAWTPPENFWNSTLLYRCVVLRLLGECWLLVKGLEVRKC